MIPPLLNSNITLKTLNLSLLQFVKQSRFENHDGHNISYSLIIA